ncbi:MAG: hypothetical protein QF732_07590 [Nitrospinaceae bacterium]|nr:hypothetical protein [Nitrospinaceae bacterium]
MPLGQPLRHEPGVYPDDLIEIDYEPLRSLLLQFDRDLSTPLDNVAENWAVLEERMKFICDLFRSRQYDGDLLGGPFSPRQMAAIDAGTVPADIDDDSPYLTMRPMPAKSGVMSRPLDDEFPQEAPVPERSVAESQSTDS